MGIIKENIVLYGEKGDLKTEALFDSGATFSFIKKNIAEKLGNISKLKVSKTFNTAEIGREILIDERIVLDFLIDGETLSDEFMVSESLNKDILIGASTMQKWRIKLDFDNDKALVDHEIATLNIM